MIRILIRNPIAKIEEHHNEKESNQMKQKTKKWSKNLNQVARW